MTWICSLLNANFSCYVVILIFMPTFSLSHIHNESKWNLPLFTIHSLILMGPNDSAIVHDIVWEYENIFFQSQCTKV